MSDSQGGWPFAASIIYTALWSMSFYGQVYENWKLKSVEGFSLDYLVLNITGYLLYSSYCSIGYFTKLEGAGTVVVADLFFTYHGLFVVTVQSIQCLIYPKGQNRVTRFAVIVAVAVWTMVITEIFLSEIIHVLPWRQYWNPLSVMGYGKLFISFVKYSPPVYWNYKRKSTKGWSIVNILLDVLGGIFSLASGTLSVTNGLNLTKVILAGLTIFYDIIFIIQHYILYRHKTPRQTIHQQLVTSQNMITSYAN